MRRALTQLIIVTSMVFAISLITACDDAAEVPTETVEQAVTAEMVYTQVLFAVDRSSSMLGHDFLPFVSDAIKDVVLEMEDFARFGMIMFPGPDCAPGSVPEESCATPAEPYVLIDPDYSSAEDVADVFNTWEDGVGVCGATPTAATLDVAKAYLNDIAEGSPQMIVLITDGVPNCNFDLDGDSCECTAGDTCNDANAYLCLDDVATGDAAAALKEEDVPVYVLSLGEEITPFDHVMDMIAFEGGTETALTAKEVAEVAPKISQIQPEMYSCQVAMDFGKISDLTKESKISTMAGKISLWGKESETKESKISYNPGCAAGEGFDIAGVDKISLCASVCNSLKESKISAISATAKISKESKISATAKISLID